MDIVIPLGKGSKHQNLELRFALRSLEQFFPGRGQVFIIGELPPFLQQVIHIPANDLPGFQFKERNIFQKLVLACNDSRISEEFLYMNDDHFLLEEWEGWNYYDGFLSDTLLKATSENYTRTLRNTIAYLGEGKDFDVHCPMVFKKDLFKRTVGAVPWNVAYGYCIKSLYGNINQFEGVPWSDCKIRKPLKRSQILTKLSESIFFSVSDTALNKDMLQVLEDQYQQKSVYEK